MPNEGVIARLERAIADGSIDMPPLDAWHVELGQNGAGQRTYRVVTVSVDQVVPDA